MKKNVPSRAVVCKMYPSKTESLELDNMCNLHRLLTNAAIEERTFMHKNFNISVNYHKQAKSLTEIRNADIDFSALTDDEINNITYINKLQEFLYTSARTEYIEKYKDLTLQEKMQAFHDDFSSLNAQSCQQTLKRVQRSFDNFFRRVGNGEKPGYPRFKSKTRFSGFGYNAHGDGFKFTPKYTKEGNIKQVGGNLKLSGIGDMPVRGRMRTPGVVACSSISRKNDDWYLTLFVHCEPTRTHGDRECGLDWGTETFIQLAYDENGVVSFEKYENERFLKQELEDLKQMQRDLSLASRGKKKKTKKSEKKRKLLSKRSRKVANRRKNKLHQVSAQLIKNHRRIYSEELDVVSMTQSASNSLNSLAKAIKTGTNRSVLDTSPGSLVRMIDYKAEEAGSRFICLDTKTVKPSQHCPDCFAWTRRKPLTKRKHVCNLCGCTMSRDEASSLYMLRRGRQLYV